MGNALAHKQAQLITMHSLDLSGNGPAIKGLVVCWKFIKADDAQKVPKKSFLPSMKTLKKQILLLLIIEV